MDAVRKKSPTILDVAAAAGVSRPTVSRVLTGAVPVSKATRSRVEAAMKSLGYRPNGAARALSVGQQPIVGVITGEHESWARQMMLTAIEGAARAAGYMTAITILAPEDIGASALDLLLSQPIVGVIVLDFDTYDTELLKSILGNIPVATVTGREVADVQHIFMDDTQAAYEVTRALLADGHDTVHHVGVPGMRGPSHPREIGWRRALEEAGVRIPAVQMTDWSIAQSRAAGAALARDASVTAIFCSNDEIAYGVMRSLHEAGRKVPDDVSVAGLDNDHLADTWVPSLTTFQMDWAWAGAAVFGLLLGADPANHALVPPRSGLVIRESTRPRASC